MPERVFMMQRTWFGDSPSHAVLGYQSNTLAGQSHLQLFKISNSHVGYLLTTYHETSGHYEYIRGWIYVATSRTPNRNRTDIVKDYLRNRHGITIAFIEYPFGIDEEETDATV